MDACNNRVWEKTYNVNLESLKGGKNIQDIQSTPYIQMGAKNRRGQEVVL